MLNKILLIMRINPEKRRNPGKSLVHRRDPVGGEPEERLTVSVSAPAVEASRARTLLRHYIVLTLLQLYLHKLSNVLCSMVVLKCFFKNVYK